MKVATILATFAAVTSAYKFNNDAIAASGDKCVDCAKYCSDDSNGSALGAACYIVKCGISCIIA